MEGQYEWSLHQNRSKPPKKTYMESWNHRKMMVPKMMFLFDKCDFQMSRSFGGGGVLFSTWRSLNAPKGSRIVSQPSIFSGAKMLVLGSVFFFLWHGWSIFESNFNHPDLEPTLICQFVEPQKNTWLTTFWFEIWEPSQGAKTNSHPTILDEQRICISLCKMFNGLIFNPNTPPLLSLLPLQPQPQPPTPLLLPLARQRSLHCMPGIPGVRMVCERAHDSQ